MDDQCELYQRKESAPFIGQNGHAELQNLFPQARATSKRRRVEIAEIEREGRGKTAETEIEGRTKVAEAEGKGKRVGITLDSARRRRSITSRTSIEISVTLRYYNSEKLQRKLYEEECLA